MSTFCASSREAVTLAKAFSASLSSRTTRSSPSPLSFVLPLLLGLTLLLLLLLGLLLPPPLLPLLSRSRRSLSRRSRSLLQFMISNRGVMQRATIHFNMPVDRWTKQASITRLPVSTSAAVSMSIPATVLSTPTVGARVRARARTAPGTTTATATTTATFSHW